jgi:F0F1-type ATP synthase membrane subunit b/b'
LGFSFDSFLVIIAFGIFLIIISKIINQSIKIQQENDLTI